MKKLSLFDGISVTVGLIVATSCLVSLGTGMGMAGPAFILPMFVVMILNMFVRCIKKLAGLGRAAR